MSLQIMTEEEANQWQLGLDEWWGTLGWNTKEAVRRLLTVRESDPGLPIQYTPSGTERITLTTSPEGNTAWYEIKADWLPA